MAATDTRTKLTAPFADDQRTLSSRALPGYAVYSYAGCWAVKGLVR
jgi:hypothetical protein